MTNAEGHRNGHARGSVKLAVRLPEDLIASLDNWRSRERPVPTRSGAIRSLMERGLAHEVTLAVALKDAVNQLIVEGLLPLELDRSVSRRLAHLVQRRLDPTALDALQRRGRQLP